MGLETKAKNRWLSAIAGKTLPKREPFGDPSGLPFHVKGSVNILVIDRIAYWIDDPTEHRQWVFDMLWNQLDGDHGFGHLELGSGIYMPFVLGPIHSVFLFASGRMVNFASGRMGHHRKYQDKDLAELAKRYIRCSYFMLAVCGVRGQPEAVIPTDLPPEPNEVLNRSWKNPANIVWSGTSGQRYPAIHWERNPFMGILNYAIDNGGEWRRANGLKRNRRDFWALRTFENWKQPYDPSYYGITDQELNAIRKVVNTGELDWDVLAGLWTAKTVRTGWHCARWPVTIATWIDRSINGNKAPVIATISDGYRSWFLHPASHGKRSDRRSKSYPQLPSYGYLDLATRRIISEARRGDKVVRSHPIWDQYQLPHQRPLWSVHINPGHPATMIDEAIFYPDAPSDEQPPDIPSPAVSPKDEDDKNFFEKLLGWLWPF